MTKVMRASDSQSDLLLKLIIIGDSGVGKSNLLMRLCDEQFKQTYTPTIGVDFKIKSIMMSGRRLKFQIWDTAGQERYRTITQTYYKGAHGVLLVYSVTDRKSFQSVESWLKQIQEYGCQSVKIVLIGNKADLEEDREVSTAEGELLADKNSLVFKECSAKTGLCVQESFEELGRLVLRDYRHNQEKYKSAVLNTQQLVLTKNSVKKNCAC